MVRTADQDASRMPCVAEETLEQTQNTVVGLNILFGLGTPQIPPGRQERPWLRVKDTLATLLSLLPTQPGPGYTVDNGWMANWVFFLL